MSEEIQHLVTRLDARQADVLTLRFGLDRGAPRTLRAVASQLDLEPAQVARIERRALERLRASSD